MKWLSRSSWRRSCIWWSLECCCMVGHISRRWDLRVSWMAYRCSPVFQQTVVCNDSSPTITLMQQTNCDVINMYLKIINPDKQSELKVFTLKNPQSSWFATIVELRKHLVSQFGSKVVYPDSGLGYMRGQTKVWMHNESNLRYMYVWKMIEEGSNCTLWCDAYQKTSKKSHSDSDESDNEKCRHKRCRKASADNEKWKNWRLKTRLCPKHPYSIFIGQKWLMLVLPVVWMSRPLSLCSLVRQNLKWNVIDVAHAFGTVRHVHQSVSSVRQMTNQTLKKWARLQAPTKYKDMVVSQNIYALSLLH